MPPIPAAHPEKVDIIAALHMASLVDARPIADALHPRILGCAPWGPRTLRHSITPKRIVVALKLTGHTNPSRSAGSGTCRLLLRMLQV
jgi:hypothetical protein